MLCPHCSTAVKYDHKVTDSFFKSHNPHEDLRLVYSLCPQCQNLVIFLQKGNASDSFPYGEEFDSTSEELIYPNKSKNIFSNDIPKIFLEDYDEALNILPISPKSSAALTRRLLQSIIREKYNIKEKDLYHEIEKFINLPGIPSHLSEAVDAIRHIGNIAAHPTKNITTGEIVPVEIGEAEWLIEVIEALFDFCFIQPKKLEKRKNELNKKLKSVGKQQMK